MHKQCAVSTCHRCIDEKHFMCLDHWKKVSRATQRQIYRTQRALLKGTLSETPYAAAVTQAIREAKDA